MATVGEKAGGKAGPAAVPKAKRLRYLRPLLAYVAACAVLSTLAWALYVWEPMSQLLDFVAYELRFLAGVLSAVLGVELSPVIIVLAFLGELCPSLCYALTGRRIWLGGQCGLLVLHCLIAAVSYFQWSTWID